MSGGRMPQNRTDSDTISGHTDAPMPHAKFSPPSAEAARSRRPRATSRLVGGMTHPMPTPAAHAPATAQA